MQEWELPRDNPVDAHHNFKVWCLALAGAAGLEAHARLEPLDMPARVCLETLDMRTRV